MGVVQGAKGGLRPGAGRGAGVSITAPYPMKVVLLEEESRLRYPFRWQAAAKEHTATITGASTKKGTGSQQTVSQTQAKSVQASHEQQRTDNEHAAHGTQQSVPLRSGCVGYLLNSWRALQRWVPLIQKTNPAQVTTGPVLKGLTDANWGPSDPN